MIAETITLCNKLARKDSITNLDVWYKTVLHNVPYTMKKISNVTGTTVSVGQTFMILLPFDGIYKPYDEWIKMGGQGYTLSEGDYIFMRELEEEITPNTIQKIKNQYEPNVCEIRSIVEVSDSPNINYRFKIEGV